MSLTQIANYHHERELFRQLLTPVCPKPILIFHGDSGMGKTRLVAACIEMARNYEDTVCCPIDFKAPTGVAECLSRLWRCIGLPPPLRHGADAIGGAQASIENVNIEGDNSNIIVAINSFTREERDERRVTLTDAFFSDLANKNARLILALDSFEQANSEVQQWILGTVLERITRAKRARILIAGQKVPESESIVWGDYCELCSLLGIREAEHWEPVVEAMGLTLPSLDWLAGFCRALGGRPKDIMQGLVDLRRLQ